MKRAYEEWNPGSDAVRVLSQAETIVNEYRRQGYTLTLRQLYYQFVARDLIPNTDRSYKRLGSIIDRGRKAGWLDWLMIEDRTRNLRSSPHWADPSGVVRAAAQSYGNDLWLDQPTRVEVWVEKEALAGVVARAADAWDCSWFSCRGYVSQSEMWSAAQRVGGYITNGQRVLTLHLGDHDPSGIDMSRDIEDRLRLFTLGDHADRSGWHSVIADEDECHAIGGILAFDAATAAIRRGLQHENDAWQLDTFDDWFEVRRIALNMDQIREWSPPPNPAKITDSRSDSYISKFGRLSWELDVLPPRTMDQLIQDHIAGAVDMDRYEAARDRQETDRGLLERLADQWVDVATTLTTTNNNTEEQP